MLVILENPAAQSSPPITLFLQSVIEVMTVAFETTTASLAYWPFHPIVEVWIAHAESTMMYVVADAHTVMVPPAY